jgi:excisionase family DNA binding protein
MADDLANDLIGGVPAIAAFLGFSQRQTYHLLEKGKLPAFKIGDRKWQARKSTLRRHIENLEAPRAQG